MFTKFEDILTTYYCNKHSCQVSGQSDDRLQNSVSDRQEIGCKNGNRREITKRQHRLELWFFHTALHIITDNTNAKCQVNQIRDVKVMLVVYKMGIEGQFY